MSSGGHIVMFILAIAGGFVYICHAIPQIKSDRVEIETEIGDSPEELVAAGKRVFNSDRAQCLTCHSVGEDPKARCPNQDGLGARAAEQIPGVAAPDYLIEAAYDPNAFVVAGYPSNQMTPINKPPIALSHDEILAILAYLNTLGGETDLEFIAALMTAQDPWRKGLLKPGEGERREQLPILEGDPQRGHDVYQAQACVQCHRIGDMGRDVCPDLTAIGASQTPQYILESIIDPSAVIVKGYRATIVFWQDESRLMLRGTAIAWLPNKDHPATLRLAVLKGEAGGEDEEEEEEEAEGEEEPAASDISGAVATETIELDIDLSQAAQVGDTIVGMIIDGEFSSLCGEYIEGDAESGLTLKFLEGGQWVERRMEPEQIEFVNLPMSPMPANFADVLTPREAFDLVAYLRAQKGETQ